MLKEEAAVHEKKINRARSEHQDPQDPQDQHRKMLCDEKQISSLFTNETRLRKVFQANNELIRASNIAAHEEESIVNAIMFQREIRTNEIIFCKFYDFS